MGLPLDHGQGVIHAVKLKEIFFFFTASKHRGSFRMAGLYLHTLDKDGGLENERVIGTG